MHNTNPSQRVEGPKPKRPPRWRDLSDEEQWDRIYKDREKANAVKVKNVAQATALCLPAYTLQMAIQDCADTFQATVREDVHTAILTSLARIAGMLPTEKKRTVLLRRLEHSYGEIRRTGFYIDNREFLYANAAALVKLVDDYRFPPDAPVTMAAVMLKEDAETDEVGDWRLDKRHALKMTEVAYDVYLDTGFYAYPDAKMS